MKITNGLFNSTKAFLQDRKAQNLSKRSIEWYEYKLQGFLNFCSDNQIKEPEEITPQFLRSYLLYLQDKGHNDGGVRSYYRAIKAFLNFYELEFEPDNWKNPIKKIKPPKEVIEPIEGIGKDTVNELISLCKKGSFNGERDRTILMVLLETGVRASELLQLNIEDIDFSDSSILVKLGKGRKPRSVFIGQLVRRQIRRYLKFRNDSNPALFISNLGIRLTYPALREIVRRLSIRAGIPEPGIHSFRRTFALEMLRRKVDIQTIARLMGHSSLQVISRYLRQTKGDLGDSFKSIMDD